MVGDPVCVLFTWKQTLLGPGGPAVTQAHDVHRVHEVDRSPRKNRVEDRTRQQQRNQQRNTGSLSGVEDMMWWASDEEVRKKRGNPRLHLWEFSTLEWLQRGWGKAGASAVNSFTY
jgi:hypothetical protein